ncbi:MAG: hypothetical protein WCK86_20830 [Planctomycetia bacterium]
MAILLTVFMECSPTWRNPALFFSFGIISGTSALAYGDHHVFFGKICFSLA